MDTRQLRYFLAVVEAGTFTRAAAVIPVAQSALSAQIAALERHLGCELLERTRSGVRLTEAGAALVPAARRVLRDLDLARQEVDAVTGLHRGTVSLGAVQAMPVLDLPAALRAFHDRYPAVQVRLREDGSVTMLAALSVGELDLGLLTLPPGDLPEGLAAEPILDEPLVALLPAGHPATHLASVTLADLRHDAFVDFKRGSGLRAHVDQAHDTAGLFRRTAFEVAHLDTLVRLVAQGLGVALLFRSAAQELGGPDVVVAALSDTALRSTFALVHSDRRRPSPAASALHRHLRQHVRGPRPAAPTTTGAVAQLASGST